MSKPSFSVVIPLYNKEESIAETIASVLAQTVADFELIVVDDGSKDQSAAIVKAIDDPRLQLIQQANGGVSVARNTGIAHATADFVAFLDADDRWDADFLETISALKNRFPEAAVLAAAYRLERAQGDARSIALLPDLVARGPALMPDYFAAATFGVQPFYTSSVCVARAAFERVGGFPAGVRHAEDLDMWARLALDFTIAYTPEAKVSYRIGAENRAMSAFPALTPWVFRQRLPAALARADLTEEQKGVLREHVARVDIYTAMMNLTNPDGGSVRGFLRGIETRAFARKRSLMLAFLCLPCSLRRVVVTARRR